MKTIISFLIIVLLYLPVTLTGETFNKQRFDTMGSEVWHTTIIRKYREEDLVMTISSWFKHIPKSTIRSIVHEAFSIATASSVITEEDILAIIWVESGFNVKAFNNGSIGLMQVEAKSHPEKIKGRDLTDIRVNMEVGVKVVEEYFKRVRDLKGTLLAYNAGIGNYLRGNYNTDYYEKVSQAKAILVRV